MKSTHNKIEIVLPTGKKIVRTVFSGDNWYGAFVRIRNVWFQYDYIDENANGACKLTCCEIEDIGNRFINAGVDSDNGVLAYVADPWMDRFHKVICNEFFNGVK